MRIFRYFLLATFLLLTIVNVSFAQTRDLLTPEEALWLKSRNSTIVVYPEENSPPYSYKNSAGNPQGLAIDYLELIAEKIGAKMEYLTPRPRSQIMTDFQNGKGDVVALVTPDQDKETFLVFTENYISSGAVIVVRKDYPSGGGLTLNDFNGKRIGVTNDSALESYIRINYPRIVLDEMTDNEVNLQQVVLGEIDAAAMDIASLSYFLSKQVLSSVKIVGSTGFENKPSFGVRKNLTILQSILEKGLTQISSSDRSLLVDKWIVVPQENKDDNSLFARIERNLGFDFLYLFFGLGIIGVAILVKKRGHIASRFYKKRDTVSELKEDMSILEKTNDMLAEELKEIQTEEEKIKEKLRSLDK